MTIPKTDIVGNRYGMLVVKEITKPKNQKSRCIVLCDCGNQTEVNIGNLKRGNTTTCGCSQKGTAHNNTDIEGKRYGRLVVVRRGDSEKNRARWFCQCDCGRTCLATGKTLRQGKKQSCGCIKREQLSLPDGEASRNHLMVLYKMGAARRGLPFELSVEDFVRLTSSDCHYCGETPSSWHKTTATTGYLFNGIDRVENDRGYLKFNCVPCCTTCNRMKMAHSQSDFIEKCTVIAARYNNYKKSAEMSDSL